MEVTALRALRLLGALPSVGLEATRRGVGVGGAYEEVERETDASSQEKPWTAPEGRRKSVGVTNAWTESLDLELNEGVTGVPHSDDVDGR
jgi:hypothetical protein